MRIAFYAPMKPPDDPIPSGDRRMARLLMEAMRKAGHKVDLASKFRSRDGKGDPLLQRRIVKTGERWAERLVDRYRREAIGARPDIWFTYHLYYKAPDILGPIVADRLEIPYVVAEASHAQNEPTAIGLWFHKRTEFAISRADAAIMLNPADLDCVSPILKTSQDVVPLRPFLDLGPCIGPARTAQSSRPSRHWPWSRPVPALADRGGDDAERRKDSLLPGPGSGPRPSGRSPLAAADRR